MERRTFIAMIAGGLLAAPLAALDDPSGGPDRSFNRLRSGPPQA